MTKVEFTRIMLFMSGVSGKPVSEAMASGYFDFLGDLPAEVLEVAAKRALLEAAYPMIPLVGVLRRLAEETLRGNSIEPTAGEAWGIALRAAAGNYLREREILADLPPLVARAIRCFGFKTLCDATETEILGAQFRKVYDTLVEREKRQGLLPPALRASIERIGAMPIEEQRDETTQRQHLRIMEKEHPRVQP